MVGEPALVPQARSIEIAPVWNSLEGWGILHCRDDAVLVGHPIKLAYHIANLQVVAVAHSDDLSHESSVMDLEEVPEETFQV